MSRYRTVIVPLPYRYCPISVPLQCRYRFYFSVPYRSLFPTVPGHFPSILTDLNVKEYFLEKSIIFAFKLRPQDYFIFKFIDLILLKKDNKPSLNHQ